MSKYVKELITREFSRRLDGVSECLLVNIVGLNAIQTQNLRKRLREKGIQLMLVKNSLARRATAGTALAKAFDSPEGNVAVVWGSEDIVSLAKEVTALIDDKAFDKLKPKGGVLDGEPLAPEQLKEVAKWPNRKEQLAMVVGQILGPGSQLVAQILGPGRKLASQVKKKGEGDDGAPDSAAEPAPASA